MVNNKILKLKVKTIYKKKILLNYINNQLNFKVNIIT